MTHLTKFFLSCFVLSSARISAFPVPSKLLSKKIMCVRVRVCQCACVQKGEPPLQKECCIGGVDANSARVSNKKLMKPQKKERNKVVYLLTLLLYISTTHCQALIIVCEQGKITCFLVPLHRPTHTVFLCLITKTCLFTHLLLYYSPSFIIIIIIYIGNPLSLIHI